MIANPAYTAALRTLRLGHDRDLVDLWQSDEHDKITRAKGIANRYARDLARLKMEHGIEDVK